MPIPTSPLSPKTRKIDKKVVPNDSTPKIRRPPYDQKDLAECFERLFDVDDYSYLPLDQQLAKYGQRDLLESKLYKTALSIYNISGPRPRNFTNEYISKLSDGPSIPNSLTAKHQEWKNGLSSAPTHLEPLASSAPNSQDLEKDYRDRINKRKKLRSDLNDLGNIPKFLEAKFDRTPIEEAFLKRHYDAEKLKLQKKAPTRPRKVKSPVRVVPSIKSPAPLALQAIDKHIFDKRWRLLELFQQADINKKWRISVANCYRIVESEKLPISKSLVEQLIFELDKDDKGDIDYRELIQGLLKYQRDEKPAYRYSSAKSQRSRSRPSSTLSTATSTFDFSGGVGSRVASAKLDGSDSDRLESGSSRPNSSFAGSPTRLKHLVAPPADTRADVYEHANKESQVDARKSAMNALKFEKRCKQLGVEPSEAHSDKFMVRVGYKKWDDHVAPSTLVGPSNSNDVIDRYRQTHFRKYVDLLELCKRKGVVLSESLLERVLLHPADKPHDAIADRIAIPGDQLLTSDTSKWNPTVASEDESESESESEPDRGDNHYGSMERNCSWIDRSRGVIDPKRAFPKFRRIAPREKQVTLVTGPARIRKTIDNWLSFEEYLALTEHLGAKRSATWHACSKKDSFWPGSMLDKTRLCMPPYDRQLTYPSKSHVFFQHIPKEMH